MKEEQEEKNRGGRPKLPENKKKSAKIIVHLSEGDRKRVEQLMQRTGKKHLSRFILQSFISYWSGAGSKSAPRLFQLSADERRDLHGIGNNLNQLTRLLHSGRKVDKRVLEQVEETKVLIQKLHARIARPSGSQESSDDT